MNGDAGRRRDYGNGVNAATRLVARNDVHLEFEVFRLEKNMFSVPFVFVAKAVKGDDTSVACTGCCDVGRTGDDYRAVGPSPSGGTRRAVRIASPLWLAGARAGRLVATPVQTARGRGSARAFLITAGIPVTVTTYAFVDFLMKYKRKVELNIN